MRKLSVGNVYKNRQYLLHVHYLEHFLQVEYSMGIYSCTHTLCMKESVSPQEAKEITFGEPYYVDQFTANVHRKVSRTDKFYYVPLCSTLQKLMDLDDYQAEVLNPHISTSSSVLGDFCDGTLYQSHPLFSIDPYALQIIGYYDELEVVNPLGSYVKKHKLGCLFFFLGNIRPQYRSTLKSIQLVAVGLSKDIQKYGINAFLAPFVDDLKKLYCDGIVVLVGGEHRTFHGALLAFLADTLAAHTVGGFKGSMSFALRVCRTCMATPEQLQGSTVESYFTLRTPHSYFQHCRLLSGPLRAHYSTTYGINYMSILEEAPGYSVVQGLPHDIMHDLYEGVIPYEMKLLICYYIDQKYFTIEDLNERIEKFGFTDNKPRPLDTTLRTSDIKIRQSASQMMTLCQVLPLLIADRIPLDDPHWNSFLLLLRISSVANSPVCTPDTIAYLRIVIEEKLETFKTLYPTEKLLPKHHYMVHYPSQMERLGPLIQSWTMRQEAKLSFVKRVSRQSNFKNVCKTVAKKHQFWMCYQLLKDQHVLTPSTTSSPRFKTNPLLNEDECVRAEFIRLIPSICMDSEIHHFEWLKIQSSMLQKGMFVMLEYSTDTPIFGFVVDILCFEETVVLYVQKYFGELFNSHYNAFVVKSHGEFIVVNLLSLRDYRPITVKHNFVPSDHQLYAVLPYYY